MEEYQVSKLDENEKILLVVKKHWFVVLLETFLLVGFILLPFLFYFFTERVSPGFITGNVVYLNLAVGAASILIGWIIFFIVWTDYYLDSWLITNKRVIDIEQKGLFNRDIATLKLDKIQDVTFAMEGIIATVIGFGEIRVQTAGTQTEFKMSHVPNPRQVAELILKIQHEHIEK
jgi:uncharacterized membrane protein YdbT with pleckstrin-like domain